MEAAYIVDAHQHFQDLSNPYPWLRDLDRPPQLEGDLAPLRRNYLPADYARDTAGHPIRKVVHVQNGWDPADPLGETVWLQHLAAREGRPDAIVAFADLADPTVERRLEAHAAHVRVRGIRQILNWHADPRLRVACRPDLMQQAAWRRGFALLERYAFSFDLQIYWPQMDMALSLARDHPATNLVLDHFGMPVDRSADGLARWEAAMRRLSVAANVSVKLSGLGLGHPHWRLADTVPLLRRTIDIFGPDRVMVGSNLPVDRLFAPGDTILHAIGAAVCGCSQFEAAGILHANAERIYRI